MSSADQFRSESCDIYQLITINYTAIGAEGSSIAIIRSDGSFIESVQTRAAAAGAVSSDDRIELIPDVRSVWNQRGIDIIQIPGANYENASYMVQRTYTNNTVGYLNLSTNFNSTATWSGYRYQYILLPAYDVAYDWCRRNGAVLNSVDAVNLTIDANERLVDMLTVQISDYMTPDLNLDDGYDGAPVIGAIDPATLSLLAGLTVKLVLIILAFVAFLYAVNAGVFDHWFDFSTNQNNTADQHLDVPWTTDNTTAHWDDYETICNASGNEATYEGFMEYLKTLGEMSPVIAPTWNNNWTANPTGSGSGNVLTSIVAFIKDLLPLIIAVIIVIAFVVAFVMIYRAAKRFMPSG